MSVRSGHIRYWEYFVVAAEQGSLSQAAVYLGITQPPVSQGIKRLESEVGGQLLERRRDGVHPTSLGRTLLPQARVLIRDAQELHNLAEDTLGSGALRIGFVPSLPNLCAAMIAQEHSFELDPIYSSGTAAELVRKVEDGEIDCAIIEDPSPLGSLVRGKLHELPRLLFGGDETNKSLTTLRDYVLLDDTRAISPAAADRLADAFFSMGVNPTVRPRPENAILAAELGSGRAIALSTPDCPFLAPGFTLGRQFNLRLRVVVSSHRNSTESGRDIRSILDSVLTKSVRRMESLKRERNDGGE